jgi:hypothetical protein
MALCLMSWSDLEHKNIIKVLKTFEKVETSTNQLANETR